MREVGRRRGSLVVVANPSKQHYLACEAGLQVMCGIAARIDGIQLLPALQQASHGVLQL